ncbi:uncharacterized protein LOC105184775 [Harpegnathos saltator]|uniref:uncharacterized protein LOC105184775 n=1 Tax=Harpegnathos saltator TaxID=610380 RepID=UPI0009488D28|nr:uncharacterized protein LOC105184775 [Harpegnathos saltator]
MKRDIKKSTPKSSTNRSGKTKKELGVGRFTFRNGDSYEGKYEINVAERTLVKQDEGIYITDNFDIYDGKWSEDRFANEDFHIRYNNNAQYKGRVAANGAMDGTGTYIFPDKSSLTAVWSRNKPVSDVVYKELLGQEWMVETISESVSEKTKAQEHRSRTLHPCTLYKSIILFFRNCLYSYHICLQQVSFTTGNHFWNEIREVSSKGSAQSFIQQ